MNWPIGKSRFSAMSTYMIYQDGGIGDSQPQNMPGTEWESTTLKTFAWGLWRQDLPVTNCRLANGQRLAPGHVADAGCHRPSPRPGPIRHREGRIRGAHHGRVGDDLLADHGGVLGDGMSAPQRSSARTTASAGGARTDAIPRVLLL